MKILYMGTPEFAVPSLEALCQAGHEVCAVFTQPDKPKNRGMKLSLPPVKEAALARNIPVYQPETLKDGAVADLLKELDPDLIAVVAYGKLLPEYVLAYPKHGCINVHGSLLPKYRGAAPIQWSVIHGCEKTGITTMRMNQGLDTGDMLKVLETPIGAEETSGDLHDRLMHLGATLLVETVAEIQTLVPQKQNDAEATYAPMLKKELGLLDFSKPAQTLHDLIRGLCPWPVAYTMVGDIPLKVFSAQVVDSAPVAAGCVLAADSKNGLVVACGDGKALCFTSVQLSGKKRMNTGDFLRGYEIKLGTIL